MTGNLWVIVVILSSPSMRKKPINILFTSQSCLDMTSALLLILSRKVKIFVPEGGHFGILGNQKTLFDSPVKSIVSFGKRNFLFTRKRWKAVFLMNILVFISGILNCYLWDSKHLPWSLLFSSFYNLLFINLERWICLTFPLYYKTSIK